ncbi:sensor histidine kinase [Paradesulfitobacterium ferrireducens]|uniref:sensor histidine kinase n=1 Tax=Paradesulfitobacterium ferrireducens TaxID=2816476 RepID=UPI001A8F2153|nr:ATP-binding protein [Paradesulfitobacterium ferrireducens]
MNLVLQRMLSRVLGVTLRAKIMGLVVGLLLTLAAAAIFQTERSIGPFLNQQLDVQGISTATYIADRSPEYIYRWDLFRLYTLVRDARNSNENIRYIFIVDPEEKVLVDTFGNALPSGLLKANQVGASEPFHVSVIDTEEGLIRDMALPISGGKLGTVRIGMSVKGIAQAKSNLLTSLILVTFSVLLLGIFLATQLSRILTTPYRRMMEGTRIIAAGDLSYRLPEWSIQDEGGQLTQAFNGMIENMEASARKIEELSIMRRGLAGKVMRLQEKERLHLARELHDETSQSLASLRLGLKYAEEAPSLEEMKTRLTDVRHFLDETFDGIRRLVTELRPHVLEEGEIGLAIKRYAEEYKKRFGIEVDVTIADLPEGLSSETASSLYRIVQEVLTNVVRHAKASQVSIVLNSYQEDINLTIEDNGIGFNVPEVMAKRVENRKFGLFGIQERVMAFGGTSQIESAPGQGTTIYVKVPGGANVWKN